jgi:hypothetical protein
MMRRIVILFNKGRLVTMRTTINIDEELLEKLEEAMDTLHLSRNEMVSLLLTRIIRENEFEPRPHERIRYQERGKGLIIWKKKHINIDSVFYEKFLDLRRNFKFSVSWFIAFAIRNYLDELVDNLSNLDDTENFLDNYDRNFVYITNKLNNNNLFVSILGFPELKYLKKLLNITD